MRVPVLGVEGGRMNRKEGVGVIFVIFQLELEVFCKGQSPAFHRWNSSYRLIQVPVLAGLGVGGGDWLIKTCVIFKLFKT